MSVIEIVLIIIGAGVFLLGYLLPAGKKDVDEEVQLISEAEIRKLVDSETERVRDRVSDIVDETIGYSIEKTERAMERVANEKIMAVNEYSDTVLSEIHKNHEEAMFLYDMLNSKHTNLKDTVSAVNRTVKEVEEKVNSLKAMTNVSVNPQVSAQEFHPMNVQTANTVPPAAVAVQQTTRSVNAVPSALERLASIAAPQRASTPVQAAPVSVSVVSAPVQAAPVPVSVVPAPVQAAAMSSSAAPVSAGRVSFLQEKAVDGQNNNERILELYRNGKSKVAIAKELGLGVGEVKLVIDLFRNQ